MNTSEIVVYDKKTFARLHTVGLDGLPIEEQEKQLDKIINEVNFEFHDFIHICPENKPSLRNFEDFVNACKKANIVVNRKMLADLAVNDKEAFQVVLETAKAAV